MGSSSNSMLSFSSVSPSSSSLPLVMKDRGYANWAELLPELTSSILLRLGAMDILENAQRVCKSWHRVCKDPSMWRKIDMSKDFGTIIDMSKDFETIIDMSMNSLETMYCRAVDRSQGTLVEIEIWFIGTDSLLRHIANSSSNLRKLEFIMCNKLSDEALTEAAVKLPLLEELELSVCNLSGESLKVVGKSCPKLKTLKLNTLWIDYKDNDDEFAIAIAESMPELRHLQLLSNRLTNTGLKAILEACPHLEHLDLRNCSNVNLVGGIKKRCSERIRVLILPDDKST